MKKITISELKKKTRLAIKKLLVFFEKNPKAFKSESDIKCYLYHLLIKKIPYKVKTEFDNNRKYNELLVVSEFNTNKKYKKKSGRRVSKKYDLVVLDPKCLKEKLRPLIAIEIKFNVMKSLRKSRKLKGAYKDLNKLIRKKNDVSEGHLIILNNYNFTLSVRKLYEKFENYFDDSISFKGNLYLHIRHMDRKSGELKYTC
ncbi:MAG: hypothetical protein KAS71_17565 [Bacteroidales bacterium]|nr:hypothetical protein [Bacteroidales bacterium]